MKKPLIFAIIAFLCCSFAFAQIKLISPIEGTWLNKQMLIIDTDDGGDYFYSLNGDDPEISGFAYDGPVLIDLTGEINLRIKKAGKKSIETTVKFTVYPDDAFNSSYGSFISGFYDTGILNYTAGTDLDIPSQLNFSFGLPPDSYINGQTLSISDKSVLIRMIPCTLIDPVTQKKWRFIIKTFPQNAGIYSRRDVPFYITDWDTITFTNNNLLYRIDSGYWELPTESRKLDRSVSHMISWQNLAYEFGNPVEYFVLPEKPEIAKTVLDDGCVLFNIEGDSSYSLCVLSKEDNYYQELYKTIGADTFYGDNAAGELEIGVFSNSVYQGKLKESYDIKKRPPSMPQIISNAEAFYSRKPVKVSIIGEKDCDLYISTSSPYFIKDIYSIDDKLFDSVKMSAFKKADYPSLSFMFEPQGEGTAYYKVRAYSVQGENVGKISEYSVIIDQYNYYFDATGDPSVADGTVQRPYTNFKQCLESINKGSYARLRVKGQLEMPDEPVTLLSNCSIVNDGEASLLFNENSSLIIRNSNFTIEGCRIFVDCENEKPSAVSKPLIKLENSVFDLLNCQISAKFGKNGTLIDGFSSTINLKGNIIAISSKIYSSCVSGIKTKLKVQNSSINLTSDVAVAFSLNEGDVNMKNNSLKIIAQKGRIAELFNIRGTITENNFRVTLKRVENVSPVYKDSLSNVKELNNESYGF